MEEAWNEFIGQFIELERKWKVFQQFHGAVTERESLSIEGQRVCGYSTCRSEFFVALPRWIDLARRNGGLESLLIKDVRKKKEKRDERGSKSRAA